MYAHASKVELPASAPNALPRTAAIRTLNDALRQSGQGGRVVLTAGIAALAPETVTGILAAVAGFDGFTPDNDPYGEHDSASLVVGDHAVIWKIDAYDPSLTRHSPDPADPACICRVLTIMLAEEY